MRGTTVRGSCRRSGASMPPPPCSSAPTGMWPGSETAPTPASPTRLRPGSGRRRLLVLQRLERVELRGTSRREDRGEDPDDDRCDQEDHELAPGREEVDLVDAGDEERGQNKSERAA